MKPSALLLVLCSVVVGCGDSDGPRSQESDPTAASDAGGPVVRSPRDAAVDARTASRADAQPPASSDDAAADSASSDASVDTASPDATTAAPDTAIGVEMDASSSTPVDAAPAAVVDAAVPSSTADAGPAASCQGATRAQSLGGKGYDRAEAIAALPDGTRYITGHYSDVVQLGGTSLISAGADDIFLLKQRANGDIEWAVRAGGMGSDQALAVAALADGTVYIAGSVERDASFGTQWLPDEGRAMFVAKYGPDGAFGWVRRATGTGYCGATSVAIGPDGAVYVAGGFTETCVFAAGALTSRGETDVFLTKLAADGSSSWVTQAGGSRSDSAAALAVAKDGAVYVTGDFAGSATFDSEVLVATGGYDMFLVRYRPDASLLWARRAGGEGQDTFAHGNALAVANDGSLRVTGAFGKSAKFGDLTLNGTESVFLAKYAATGDVSWVSGLPDESRYASALSVAVAGDGSSYITGGVLKTVFDMFVARFDGAGQLSWRQDASSQVDATQQSFGTSYGRGISLSDCALHIAGSFVDPWKFGTTTLTSSGSEDLFVLRKPLP